MSVDPDDLRAHISNGADSSSIIVVDGLHGPRRKTWTAENRYQWLQKGLNRDMPGARVILWGLDGTVGEGAASCLTSNTPCLQTYARRLLDDVLEQRLATFVCQVSVIAMNRDTS